MIMGYRPVLRAWTMTPASKDSGVAWCRSKRSQTRYLEREIRMKSKKIAALKVCCLLTGLAAICTANTARSHENEAALHCDG